MTRDRRGQWTRWLPLIALIIVVVVTKYSPLAEMKGKTSLIAPVIGVFAVLGWELLTKWRRAELESHGVVELRRLLERDLDMLHQPYRGLLFALYRDRRPIADIQEEFGFRTGIELREAIDTAIAQYANALARDLEHEERKVGEQHGRKAKERKRIIVELRHALKESET